MANDSSALRFKADKESNEASLFGDLEDTAIEIKHPEPGEAEKWSTLERLNKEKELVGLFLSAHPLDEYKLVLQFACNTTMAELESIPNPRGKDEADAKLRELANNPAEVERIRKIQGRDITCGGIVTAWREGVSKSGNPYGILTLEDYSGKHDFVLFGAAYPTWRGYGREGMYLYIQAKYQNKRFVREARTIFDVEFSIGSIKQLNEVSDTLMESLTVVLDHRQLTHSAIKQMSDAIVNRTFEDPSLLSVNKPTSSLFFEVCDPVKNYIVKLYSRPHKVRITPPLVDFLRSQPGCVCKINGKVVEEERFESQEVEEVMEDMLPDD